MATTTELMKPSAAAKVFNTFELLENILLYVFDDAPCSNFHEYLTPMKLIFRSQGVNSAFRDVISRSKPVRIAMFLDREGDQRDQNTREKDSNQDERESATRFGSKLLFETFYYLPGVQRFVWMCQEETPGVLFFRLYVKANSSLEKSSFLSASWRDILFAGNKSWHQVMKIHVRVYWRQRTRKQLDIETEEVFTVGELADEIVKAVEMAEDADRRGCRRLVY